MVQIETFVFVDISTTGLNHPDITEVCMVACSRSDLLSTIYGCLPRVIQKIVFPIRPIKLIDQEAMQKSRLNNEMLKKLDLFNEKDADLVNAFLKRLAQPACLIAHNGFSFDFIHLVDHFKRIGQEFAREFTYIDSLSIFRRIDDKYDRYNLQSLCDRHLDCVLEYPPDLYSAEDKALALLRCVMVNCEKFISAAESKENQKRLV